MKNYFILVYFFFFFNVLQAQFYNHDIGFKHLSIDTSWHHVYFCYTPDGEKEIRACEPNEAFAYKNGSLLNCYGYADDYDAESVLVEIEVPKDLNTTFEKLYNEIKRDTYLFRSGDNFVLTHHKDNHFVISYFENDNFLNYTCSKVISFNKVLLDGKYPLLMAFTDKDKTDYTIAFFDKNHKFQFMDNQAYSGMLQAKEELKLNKEKVQMAIKSWQEKTDTSNYAHFNGRNHLFTTNEYAHYSIRPSYDDNYNIEEFVRTVDNGENKTRFNISDIQKFDKGKLLEAVRGKVFNQGFIKFINGCGGALFINHDTKYNNSAVSYFKEIELIENVTILYNGAYTLVPFKDHFKFVSSEGQIYESIDFDFILGSNYKRRIVSSSEYTQINKVKNKWGVKDRFNKQNLLPAKYDTIFCADQVWITGVYIAKRGKSFEVFNALFEKIFSSENVKDFSLGNQYIQLLDKDKIFYLTADGIKSQSMPVFGFIDCGTNGFYDEKHMINLKQKGSYEFYFINNDGFYEEVMQLNSFTKRGVLNIHSDSIHFINGKNDFVHHYSKNDWQNHILSYSAKNVDLIKLEFIPKDSTYTQTTLLSADEFKFIDVNQPLMYRIDKLWAYYEINASPKYKAISPFNGHFARVQDAQGKMGWVNRDGREFWE